MSYLLNDDGQPFMLLAKNAAHTRNIDGNPKVALYVQNPQNPGQKGARVTLVGEIQVLLNPAIPQTQKLRQNHTGLHASAGFFLSKAR